MMKAQNITVCYDGKPAAKNLCFSLEEGQWLMLAGPNGAGKTTLLKAISQVVPYEGTVLLEGQDAGKLSRRALARKIAVLSQTQFMGYAFSVEEVVRMGRYAHGRGFFAGKDQGERLVEEALRVTGLWDIREQSVVTLSGGQAQRVALARVFAQDPAVLMLDEPVNHLDLAYQRQLLELIKNWLKTPGRAVLSVMHDLSLAKKYGTHALLVRDGEALAQGTVREALTPASLEAAYGMDVAGWMAELLMQWAGEQAV